MVAQCAFAPIHFPISGRRNVYLPGNKSDTGCRYILTLPREAPVKAKGLEQHSKSESGRAGLVSQQGALAFAKGPMLGELVAASCRATCVNLLC